MWVYEFCFIRLKKRRPRVKRTLDNNYGYKHDLRGEIIIILLLTQLFNPLPRQTVNDLTVHTIGEDELESNV